MMYTRSLQGKTAVRSMDRGGVLVQDTEISRSVY